MLKNSATNFYVSTSIVEINFLFVQLKIILLHSHDSIVVPIYTIHTERPFSRLKPFKRKIKPRIKHIFSNIAFSMFSFHL